MGWTSATATTTPLKTPTSRPTRTAATMAMAMGWPKPLPPVTTNLARTALAMAMVAPTERSTPPVPMTRAIPSETMMTGGSWANNSWMVATVRKLLVATAL